MTNERVVFTWYSGRWASTSHPLRTSSSILPTSNWSSSVSEPESRYEVEEQREVERRLARIR